MYCYQKLLGEVLNILTVVVEDGDLHDAGLSEPDQFAFGSWDEGQLDEELLVGLPLVVVHNGQADLKRSHYQGN